MALAAVACALAAWSAGPAHANGPVAGVPAPVTVVQQATAPVVRTVETSPVRTAASPGPAAARVHKARAAAAESVATAAQPAANHAASAVETTSNTAATAVETASRSELPRRAAETVRTASKHAATGVRSAPERVTASPSQLDALNTVSKLGATLVPARRDGTVTGEPVRFGGVTASTGTALAAIATGHALRHVAANGWRHATAVRQAATQTFQRAAGKLAGSDFPAPQPGSPSSAATGLAGAAAAALLGLLGLLIFGSRRPGALVWLRPASAPASPFLALPERPG